jgi:4'-phosphopantetheinyl transferase
VFPAPGEVLVITAELDVAPERLEQLRASLSSREQERYASFAHDQHRFRWGAARGTLREVLGRALGCTPGDVQFAYGNHGKPQVAGSPLRFNISHSGGLALVALGLCEVGVDVELPRPRRTDDIARRFYAPGENARLFELEGAQRVDAFFRLWTCKEAFLKVTGEGLSRSTRSFEIDLGPPARLVWAKGVEAGRYSVHPLEPAEPYRAALVAEAPQVSLRHLRWPPTA